MERLEKGLRFIEDHLAEAFVLDDAARAAGLSAWHFARSFRALTGETVQGYARRRRILLAADRLGDPGIRLIDLAFDSGFESQEAFSRAFKRVLGTSPGKWRKEGFRIDANMLRPLNLAQVQHQKDYVTMEPTFVETEERLVVGLMASFNDETKNKIPELWQAFVPRMSEISGQVPGVTFGVCFPAALGEDSFDYMAGVAVEEVADLPEGLVARVIPAHRYAVFTHTIGDDSLHNDLQKTMQFIYGTWLPNSGFELARVPDFELYDERMDPQTQTGAFDIYVPVK